MSKPREFYIQQGSHVFVVVDSVNSNPKWKNKPIHVIEKSAADALAEALEFSLHCVKQTPWIAEGPGNIKDPMFLGTGSVEGDKKVHSKYLSAKQALKTYSGTK